MHIYRFKNKRMAFQFPNFFRPSTIISDQEGICPYNINTVPSRHAMRKRKNMNKGITSWSNYKFSKLTSYELYGRQWRELLKISWGLKGIKLYEPAHLTLMWLSTIVTGGVIFPWGWGCSTVDITLEFGPRPVLWEDISNLLARN